MRVSFLMSCRSVSSRATNRERKARTRSTGSRRSSSVPRPFPELGVSFMTYEVSTEAESEHRQACHTGSERGADVRPSVRSLDEQEGLDISFAQHSTELVTQSL